MTEQAVSQQNQPQPPTQSVPSQSVPPQPFDHDQPPAIKKKNSKKNLLLLIIFLVVFLGLASLLYATGILKVNFRLSVTKPGESPTPVVKPGESPGVTTNPQESSAATVKDKYSQDTDGDGIPDFIEQATGYDPNKNDCAMKVGCGSVEGVKSKEINILFITDSSGSMAGNVSGGQKMAIAKEALKRYVDQLPESISAGLMVYGHKGSNSDKDKAVSCAGIELLYPIQKVDKRAFKTAIDSFQPTGWTPIADSFKKTKEAFADKEGQTNKIVLVSDGIETCEGDPCQVAKDLKTSGIEAIIDVIGFDVDEKARTQLRCVADVSGGKYFDATTAEQFYEIFEQMGKSAQDYTEASGCLAQNDVEYIACLMEQFRKGLNYLSPIQEELIKNNPSSPELQQVNTAIQRMTQRVNDLAGKSTTYSEKELQKLQEESKKYLENINLPNVNIPQSP